MLRPVQKWLLLMALSCMMALICAAAPQPIWIDVPFVKQEHNGCGAASIAMVMQYWQRQQGENADGSADAGQIQSVLYSQKAHGIYASEMERYFREHGFRTFAFRGAWSDLEEHLKKGRPLIVALEPQAGVERHYVVVVGVDVDRKLVLVDDPAERKLLEREWPKFEKEWKGAGNWTLLAIPREDAASVR